MVRVSLGYPSAGDEAEMLEQHAAHDRVLDLEPVTEVRHGARRAGRRRRRSTAARRCARYVVALGEATRTDPRVELGASPRAVLMLFRAAKALAALDGRDHVLPDDVQALAPSVLAHRLLLAPERRPGRRRAP